MNKPVLAFYCDCPVFGGADMVAARILADARLRERWDCRFVFRDNAPFRAGVAARLPADLPARGVRLPERLEWIEALESGAIPASLLWLAKAAFRLFEPFAFAYDVIRIWLELRRLGPRLVHVNDGGYPGALGCRAAAVAARLTGARVVFVVHNQASRRRPWDFLDALVDPLVSRCVDVFVTASSFSQGALAGRGFPRERMEIVPDGVPVPSAPAGRDVRAEFGFPAGETIFVMTAFFEPRKGHAVLLDALRALSRDPGTPRFSVALVGDGPTRPEIERAAADAGLSERVRFLGYRKDSAEILAACDGLILPSIHSEDMPLVILDAMALGKPVISTRLAAIPEEVEDGITGLLTEPGDDAGLAAALKRLAGDATLRRRLGEAGRERHHVRFDVSRMAGRYQELYAKIASGA